MSWWTNYRRDIEKCRRRNGGGALAGANSLVNRDVPAHCTVRSVPSTVVSQRGSEVYLA